MNLDKIVNEYESEIKTLINNKYPKDYIFNQYLAYQTFIRNKELEVKNYEIIKEKVLKYLGGK